MSWFKKNMHITLLIIVTAVFLTYIYITDEQVDHEYITIEKGDTLWSLAELYRGKMDTSEWIAYVKSHNNLYNDSIIVGEELYIPIEKESIYVTMKEIEESPVEVASDY